MTGSPSTELELKLIDLMKDKFGETELKVVCRLMDQDPENLGNTKFDIAYGLAQECRRTQRIPLLADAIIRRRPDLWPELKDFGVNRPSNAVRTLARARRSPGQALLILAGTVVCIIAVVMGAMALFRPSLPRDYFAGPNVSPWLSSFNDSRWYIDSKTWTVVTSPADDDAKALAIKGPGLAMPNDLGVATFYGFESQFEFMDFADNTSVGWLFWIWPQKVALFQKGTVKYKAQRFILTKLVSGQDTQVTITYQSCTTCKTVVAPGGGKLQAVNADTSETWRGPLPSFDGMAVRTRVARDDAKIRITVTLTSTQSSCAASADFDIPVDPAPARYGNIGLVGLPDTNTEVTMVSVDRWPQSRSSGK